MRALVLAATALIAVVGSGCPRRDINEARHVVAAAAQAVELADLEFAELYEQAAGDCLRASNTRAEYDACIKPWDEGVRSIARLKFEVYSVQVALDVWKATGDPADFKQAGCIFLETAAELRSLLSSLGVDILIPAGGIQC